MKIVELRADGKGVAELDGNRQVVDLAFIESPLAGMFVVVHAGFAIERLDEEEANSRIALFEELARLSVHP